MDWILFLTLCLQVPLATIVVAVCIAVTRGLLCDTPSKAAPPEVEAPNDGEYCEYCLRTLAHDPECPHARAEGD